MQATGPPWIENSLYLLEVSCLENRFALKHDVAEHEEDVQMKTEREHHVPQVSNLSQWCQRRTKAMNGRECEKYQGIRRCSLRYLSQFFEQLRCQHLHAISQKSNTFMCAWISAPHECGTETFRKDTQACECQSFRHFVQKHTAPR